jgi:hypothetical protein
MQAENVCFTSALDDLIRVTSSISQSADSVVMFEQTVLLCCVHQTIRDNIVLCELENIRLADAVDSAGSAPPLASAPLPERRETVYRLADAFLPAGPMLDVQVCFPSQQCCSCCSQ